MGCNAVVVFFVTAVFFNGDAADITWTTADDLKNGSLKACAGSNVSLNWAFTLPDGHHEYNIDWTFLGPNLPETNTTFIASSAHGHLFDGNGKYEKTTNAGIKIINVNKSDEGNYSVTVVTQSGRQLQSYTVNNSVYLRVDEPVKLEDGKLKIVYSAGPNGEIVLTCGRFLSVGNPPANVTWKYDNNITQTIPIQGAYVNLSQPLSGEQEKSYECSITRDTSSVCQAINANATISLKSLDVKLSLIEQRLKVLERCHNITGDAAVSCATTECSQNDLAEVKVQLDSVTKDNDLLERRVQALNDTLHHLHTNATTVN